MYDHIVVGTDGSDRAAVAVEHAAGMAQLCGASLHLVQGCAGPIVVTQVYSTPIAIDPADTVRACTESLESIAGPLREAGLDVAVHVPVATGHAAVCDVARDVDADLIVVGNRGMSGAKRFLGSVPNSVTHQAPCSVLIVETT